MIKIFSVFQPMRYLSFAGAIFFVTSQFVSAQNQQCFGDCRGQVKYTLNDVSILSIGIQETGRNAFLYTHLYVDGQMLNNSIHGAWGASIDQFLQSLTQQGYSTIHLVNYWMGGWCISGGRNEYAEQEARRRISESQARQAQQNRRPTTPPADDWPSNSPSRTIGTSQGTTTSQHSENGDPALIDVILNNDYPGNLQIYGFNLDGKFLLRKYGLDLIEYGSRLRLVKITNSLGGNIYETDLQGECAYRTEPNLGTGIEYTVFQIHGAKQDTRKARDIIVRACH